jgi:putative two-component system response regulator
MQTHPQIGHDILSKSAAPVFQLAAEVALRHHEKFDGSGYPGGLAGAAIPESARIIAVADVFDALSMRRPYKGTWNTEDIVAHMKAGAGAHFDPAVVGVFVAILPQLLEIQRSWPTEGAPQEAR